MTPHDLLIIGGGASGACLAYEAVRRGLKVALLEAGDLGCATSCRSTKLLHGGVRYLELAFKTADPSQLRLVREALHERGHWLQQAPFLARRLELALPTAEPISQLYYRLGFGLYDMTGNVDEWTTTVRPGERPSILKGGYWGPVRTPSPIGR